MESHICIHMAYLYNVNKDVEKLFIIWHLQSLQKISSNAIICIYSNMRSNIAELDNDCRV